MSKVAKLRPRVADLRGALEEFLLSMVGDGAAKRTLTDYPCQVNAFPKRHTNPPDYEALRLVVSAR